MKSHAKTNVTISLNEDDVERLLEDGEIRDDGVTIELYSCGD